MEDRREAERRGEGRGSLSHTTMVTQGAVVEGTGTHLYGFNKDTSHFTWVYLDLDCSCYCHLPTLF